MLELKWRWAFGLEWTRWKWETSICAQIDMVEADGERSSSNGHGGGGVVRVPMATTEVGDKRSGSI